MSRSIYIERDFKDLERSLNNTVKLREFLEFINDETKSRESRFPFVLSLNGSDSNIVIETVHLQELRRFLREVLRFEVCILKDTSDKVNNGVVDYLKTSHGLEL